MRSRSFPFRCGWVLVVLASLLLCKSQGQEPKRPRGEKYALLVGVRTYDPNELRSLPYSEDDVTALAAVLRGNGYKPDNVVLMTQTTGAENPRFLPLAERIRKELALLIGDCTEDDSILLAFAGHGVQFRGDLESYFCSADAKLDDKSTLIALGAIYKALEKCSAGLKLLMVDACRNDPRSDNSRSLSRIQLESVTRPQKTPPPGGVMAFFSCSEGERAFEHADLKHGVFFHYVIEGLSGNATDVGSDGVTLPELELYVKKQVRDLVRTKYGTRQMPELMGDSRGLVPIVTLDRAMLAYKRAKALKDRGQIEEARSAYDEALRLNPELARAYFDRGILRANSGDPNGAVDDFNAATRRGLNEAWVYAWRGSSYEKTHQYDRALADYDEAIRLDPKLAWAYNNRAWLWATCCPDEKYRDGKKAVESATCACELTAWKDADYLDTLAAAWAKAGDFDEAIKWQEKALGMLAKNDDQNRKDFQARLTLYRAKKPYSVIPDLRSFPFPGPGGRNPSPNNPRDLKELEEMLKRFFGPDAGPPHQDSDVNNVANAGKPAKTAISDLGLEVQPLTADLAKSLALPAGIKGLVISNVKEGSSADAEGIKEGDVITKVVRDRKIQPLTSAREFQDLASKSDKVSFFVTGKSQQRFVTLSKAKRSFQFPGPGGRNPSPNNPRDLKELEELLKRFFGPDGRTSKPG